MVQILTRHMRIVYIFQGSEALDCLNILTSNLMEDNGIGAFGF